MEYNPLLCSHCQKALDDSLGSYNNPQNNACHCFGGGKIGEADCACDCRNWSRFGDEIKKNKEEVEE